MIIEIPDEKDKRVAISTLKRGDVLAGEHGSEFCMRLSSSPSKIHMLDLNTGLITSVPENKKVTPCPDAVMLPLGDVIEIPPDAANSSYGLKIADGMERNLTIGELSAGEIFSRYDGGDYYMVADDKMRRDDPEMILCVDMSNGITETINLKTTVRRCPNAKIYPYGRPDGIVGTEGKTERDDEE